VAQRQATYSDARGESHERYCAGMEAVMFDKLSEPFPPEAISWRAQQVTQSGDKALALAYIKARDVMRRLDAVVGPEGWQDSYVETVKGRVICTLSIRSSDGEWISKSDGAGDTDVEGEKGGLSDAFKRAAVKWGIGRYLYEVAPVYAPCETWTPANGGKAKWSKWKPEAYRMFDAALAKASGDTGFITDEQRDEITIMAQGAGVGLDAICKKYGVASLKDIPADRFATIIKKLKATMQANAEKEAK